MSLVLTDTGYGILPNIVKSREMYIVNDTDDCTEQRVSGSVVLSWVNEGLLFNNILYSSSEISYIMPLFFNSSIIDFSKRDTFFAKIEGVFYAYSGGMLYEFKLFEKHIAHFKMVSDGVRLGLSLFIGEVIVDCNFLYKYENMDDVLKVKSGVVYGTHCNKQSALRRLAML